MLNTVLADAVLRTLCWRSFGTTWLGTQIMCLLAFHPERTFTSGAANGSCEPKVQDAAQCMNVRDEQKMAFPNLVISLCLYHSMHRGQKLKRTFIAGDFYAISLQHQRAKSTSVIPPERSLSRSANHLSVPVRNSLCSTRPSPLVSLCDKLIPSATACICSR